MSRDEREGPAARRLGRSRRVGSTGARFPPQLEPEPDAPDVDLDLDLPGPPDETPTIVLDLPAVASPHPGPIEEPVDIRTRVRPYVRTGGRTRTRRVLDIATLVSMTRPRPPITHPEHLAVEQVCDGPRSVAEVAALMAVPLGVARVLIDDMAAAGSLRIHPAAQSDGAAPARDFMARVLDGLRRL